MKTKSIFAFAAFVMLHLLPGTSRSQTRFGFTAGTTVSSMHSKVDGEAETTSSKIGFSFGVIANVPVGNALLLQPGLNFIQKGGMYKEEAIGGTDKLVLNLNYLEIPINLLYKSRQGLFIGGGPALALGLSGKWKYSSFDGDKSEETIKFGTNKEEDNFKPIEFSANLIAGYQFKNGMFISANYNLGLSNLFIDGDSDNRLNNRFFGIRLGYFLSSKK